MKKRKIITLWCVAFIGIAALGQESVLQVINGKAYTPKQWTDIERISFNVDEGVMIISDVDEGSLSLPLQPSLSIPSGPTVPLIEITTEEDLEEIPNRVDYKVASFKLSGFGNCDDVERDLNIRGRGNTSWTFAKKPYRLKFDKKVSLCGLPAAKGYVLLANYTDPSLAQFALATKIGQMLDLPYTNQVAAVDVVLNGIYKGSYVLTNKPGINAGSVDIDESNSIMWELDVKYDEDLKFKSAILGLPVMVSDPDLDNDAFEKWKRDFNEMEAAAVEINASQYVDMDVFARYLLVNEILKNDEIGWPKSVKLFKSEGGKYIFGPIWDFDAAMGHVWSGHINYTTDKINNEVWRNTLFSYLEEDSEAIAARKKYWKEIRERLPELLEYIDEYSQAVRNSALRNQAMWTSLDDFDESLEKMKHWLQLRFEALDEIIGQ